MPRRLSLAAAGRFLLDNPISGLPGRGGVTERATALGALGISLIHEYLFEGGSSTFRDDNVGASPIDVVTGSEPAHAGRQLGYASVDSVEWPDLSGSAIRHATNLWGASAFNYEMWFASPDRGRDLQEANHDRILCNSNLNGSFTLGRVNLSNISYMAPCAVNSFNGTVQWTPFGGATIFDIYGDGKPHQLIEAYETGNINNYVVYLDGVPIADGTNGGYFALLNSQGVAWNGASGTPSDERGDYELGYMGVFGNGATLTIQEVRDLFETSALDGHDMLTVPFWVELDSLNITSIDSVLLKDCLMGDVNGAVGIRSGAIPRVGKKYFELFIVAQGDSNNAIVPGIRKMLTDDAVSGLTSAPNSGNKDHFYVTLNNIYYDDAQDTGIDVDTGFTAASTGVTFMFAIDWETGQFWIGRDGVWGDNGGDPENGLNNIDVLDVNTNWAASLNNSSTLGNGEVRLISKYHEMKYEPPVGFDSWVPKSITPELSGNGPLSRAAVIESFGMWQCHRYDFEGGSSDYQLDDGDYNYAIQNFSNLLSAGVEPSHGQVQLSHASVDSIQWLRAASNDSRNSDHKFSDAHAFELWFRQPDFSQSKSILMSYVSNNNFVIGKADAAFNMPTCRNNFNATLQWESVYDVYGDDNPHQLMEIHEIDTPANYVVVMDGVPVADGNNSGWLALIAGSTGPRFNANGGGVDTDRSGGYFGSYTEFRGTRSLTLEDCRRLFAASALTEGAQMLPVPSWNIYDGENIASVGGTGDKDITLGDVVNNTGARSGAVPKNGKVYFELEIIAQGDANFWNIGFRNMLDPISELGSHDDDVDGIYVFQTTAYTGSIFAANSLQGGFGNQSTGRIYMFAMDFDNEEVYMGSDGTWHGSQDPSAGTGALAFTLSNSKNWAAWISGDSSIGNQQVRLVTANADLNYSLPTGYTAWEDVVV